MPSILFKEPYFGELPSIKAPTKNTSSMNETQKQLKKNLFLHNVNIVHTAIICLHDRMNNSSCNLNSRCSLNNTTKVHSWDTFTKIKIYLYNEELKKDTEREKRHISVLFCLHNIMSTNRGKDDIYININIYEHEGKRQISKCMDIHIRAMRTLLVFFKLCLNFLSYFH